MSLEDQLRNDPSMLEEINQLMHETQKENRRHASEKMKEDLANQHHHRNADL